jgi:tetratricopeptide (TPR) repeat protein
MEALMKVGCKAFRKSWIVVGCLALALQMSLAQKKPASTVEATLGILVEKAHALESRGRPDMAIQLWQQILLSDPRNTQALVGMARDYKLIGSADKAGEALDRLRSVKPNDPNIPKIEALVSTRAQSEELRQAGELVRQGEPDQAMRIYRDLYGDHPPDGEIALAYYQTLYGTASGKEAAIAAMRALASRNPGDPRFAIELGTMLTYNGKTRAEGIRLLKEHPKDSSAQAALRQALVWDSANPASAGELRQYLKDHPQDTELAGDLKEDEYKLARMNSGIARTPAERAAFAALNAHKLEEAQTRFIAILQQEPNNGRVAAGMGFLLMRQNNFAEAIRFLSQAEQNGYKTGIVEDALEAARFWYAMNEASQAFDGNRLEVAAARYRAALAMRPRSPEALNGLAGLLTREQQYAAAAGVYEQLVKVQPDSSSAWRGLFLACAHDGRNQDALAVSDRFPAPVKAALASDPEYLRTLTAVYHALNRDADAERVLALALSLPFPDNGASLKTDTKLQYAGILMEARRYAQAAELYTQVLNADAGNLSAWMGLIDAHHELGQNNQAIADVQKIPPDAYEAALADPGFLAMLGAIYQQANQFEVAQGLLERALRLQTAVGGKPGIALQLQLAAIYLQRNNTAQAYSIYRQVLVNNPGRVDAWKGLIDALQATSRNTEALQEIALIPAPVRKQLEAEIDFLQTEASLYTASGDIPRAITTMNRVLSHYAELKILPPPNIDVQNAWLLFNTRNDRALYPALMRLGGRQDLTVAQREAVQEIWANWSVRRAAIAMENGNVQRAVDILDAASQAFPDNMTVRKAVAGGYAQVGRAKESLALYRTVPMQDATAGDFEGAIGAALAANDKNQAESWLRQALERYPRDPAILSLAARYEQARGDNQRAADYYRASLAAMPPASPTDKLAHALAYPDQDMKAHRAVTAVDLQRLLDPDNEPFTKTTKVPPLPAYGADPYNGSAPVVPDPSQPASQPAAQDDPSSKSPSSEEQPPSAPTFNPAITAIPAAQAAMPIYAPRSMRQGISFSHSAWTPGLAACDPNTVGGLRIASQPMNSMAAQTQALFADQTDGQLSQGSAIAIHALPHAGVEPTANPGADASGAGQLTMAQYTPSAQDAAAAAYSAPKQQASPQQAKQAGKPAASTTPSAAARAKRRWKSKAARRQTAPALGSTPVLKDAPALPDVSAAETPQQVEAPAAVPAQFAPAPSGAGLTDEELEQRDLPPLRGPWVRIQRETHPVSPREEAEMQLRSIESGYSAWFGGTAILNDRSGALGYDHLADLEAPFEASMPLGYNARLTFIAKPVFLDSGQADGSSVISVLQSTTAGSTLVTIPQPIGTLTTTNLTPPAQQNAAGLGGEIQLAFPHLAIAGGYTPAGFLVATVTARAQWKPENGPFTLSFVRDSEKDSQLSFAGLRDPAGNTLGHPGQIWGGVVFNQGNVQYARGDAQSGFYFNAGGQYLSGYNVEQNSRVDGNGGAYWRILTSPEYGNLSIGANFFSMHYANNQNAFTHGMGGYFSPQAYFLANVPFTWTGHYQTRWHYNIVGGLGVQTFQQDQTPLWPLAVDKKLETSQNNPMLPDTTSVGPNYDLHSQVAYQISPHWFAGGFLNANNTRDYSAVSTGFYVRYMFRSQPSTAAGPTGLFPIYAPNDGLRPFSVP